MKSINFDNPWLLLVAIPLLAAVIVPFAISIRKDNKSKSVVTSFVLHILIACLVTLSLAGTFTTTVMTETNVFVIADLSHSAQGNADTVDEYIRQVERSLPRRSKMGVIGFGRDQAVITEMGEEFVSVKGAAVDGSATDVASALKYAASLFEANVIKRVVLITDGKETVSDSSSDMIAAVESLYAQGIYVDAVYLDDNLPADAKEVQIDSADFTAHTYLGKENSVDVLVRSSYETQAIVSLYKGEQKHSEQAVMLTQGYNVVNFALSADAEGDFDYELRIEAEGDASALNNRYAFTQSVAGKINVLLISNTEDDLATVEAVYGKHANVKAYIQDAVKIAEVKDQLKALENKQKNLKENEALSTEEQTKLEELRQSIYNDEIPFSIEELCAYDEIIVSDVDVRSLNNYVAFIDSLDKAVSLFGKSLITAGDTHIQNKNDDILKQLEDMLPVKFGNSVGDPKLYTIVMDASRSMQFPHTGRLPLEKQVAIDLLGLLDDDDYVAIVSFAGDVTVLQPPTPAANRAELAETIKAIQPTQGTFMGSALRAAFDMMKDLPFSDKQVMLIGDGMTYSLEPESALNVVTEMYENGITTSTVNIFSSDGANTLKQLAEKGHGDYYYVDQNNAEDLVLNEIADDVTESVIETPSAVTLQRKNDDVLDGITSLPEVSGYLNSRAKASATTVLTAEYIKASGTAVDVPIYSYWDYGNGRVATFTSKLSGEWTAKWREGRGARFFENMLNVNTPTEKKDDPYTLSVDYSGLVTNVEIVPAVLNPYATVTVQITYPNGTVSEEERVAFDARRYLYSFESTQLGKYAVRVTYSYDGMEPFTSTSYFNLPYYSEYDSFTTYDISTLRDVIRNRGTVYTNGNVEMVNDADEVATYEVDYTIPFLIAAIALYVIDIIIRKLKWNDIKSLFKKTA